MDERDIECEGSVQDLAAPSIERQAAEWFLRRRQGCLREEEKEALEHWLAASPKHAAAWREAELTWGSFDLQAMSPELVVARREALSAVRQAQLKRWDSASLNGLRRVFHG